MCNIFLDRLNFLEHGLKTIQNISNIFLEHTQHFLEQFTF